MPITQRRESSSRFPRLVGALALASTLHAMAVPAGAGLPDHPSLSVAPVPPWAEAADVLALAARHQATGETDPGSETEEVRSVRLLLDDSHIRLPLRGSADTFHRFAYRIESRSALEGWSSWQVEFTPANQRLELHQLRIGRDGAWQDRLESSQMSILQREAGFESQMYDDSRTLAVVLDDVRVGDVVDIAWTLRGSNPIFGGEYFGSFNLQTGEDYDLLRVSVDFPDQRPVPYLLFADANEPEVRHANGRTRLSWEAHGDLEVEYENWVPAGTLQFPWLQLSEFASWSEVVQWALPHYRLSSDPEDLEALKAIASSLPDADAEDPWRRLAAVRRFVQDDIRYFAHLMGPHSHAPHMPAEVLRRRYGDCKDKSFLLVHLLKALGIDAWPVFVHSWIGRALPDRLPSPGVFDHAIVGVEMPGGPIFVDATMRLQGGIDQISVPDYGWGLEVRPDSEALTRIAPGPEAAGSTEITYKYYIPDEGLTSNVVITTVYRGGAADTQRNSLDGTDPASTLENFVEFYTSDYHVPVSTKALEVTDDREANVLQVVETYDLDYVPADGDPITFETLPLQIEGSLPKLERDEEPEAEPEGALAAETEPETGPKPPSRRHPLSLPPTHLVETLILENESWLSWDLVPIKIERPFLRYSHTPEQQGRVMTIVIELDTLGAAVQLEDLNDYLNAVTTINEHLRFFIRTVPEPKRPRTLAFAVLTGTLVLLTVLGFGSAMQQRRRGVL